ncbi:MAG: hypothetical protein HKL95_07895 [Phycisphaerae bacterium]|nr:hypothetical protein [Phycisphaerae bacterium]
MAQQSRMMLGVALAVLALGPRTNRGAVATTAAVKRENSIYLQRRLAQRISVNLKTCTVPQAFATLADKARISIDVQQRVYQLLPLGDRTLISARFKAVSVRAAMKSMVRQLVLRIRRAGGRLVVMPSRSLRRSGRRATWAELNLLRAVHGLTVVHIEANWPADLAKQLHQPIPAVRLPIVSGALQAAAVAAVRRELPESAAQALNTYARALHCVWYVRHDRIFVSSAARWVRHQLHRPVFVHAANAPLQVVLADLSRATGLWLAPAAGLYLAVPTVNVRSDGGSAEQTLAAISGATGMTWRIEGQHLVIAPPRPLSSVGPQPGDPIMGMIRIPLADGIHLNLFVRKSQLSAAVRKRLGAKLQHDLDMLGTQLAPAAKSP